MIDLMITRSYAFGDIILASGALEAMLQYDCSVTFRTDPLFVEWFRHAPYTTIPFTESIIEPHVTLDDVVEQQEDKLIMCGQNKNRIAIACDILEITLEKHRPYFYMTDNEWDLVKKIKTLYPQPYIGISVSSRYGCKTLGYEKWSNIIDYLSSIFNGSIFIFDSPENHNKLQCKNKNNIHFLQYSWRTFTLHCRAMDFMVVPDSVWSHIAASVDVPQLLLTSCTDGELIAKDYYKAIYPKPPFDCSPCWYHFNREGCSKHLPAYCLERINSTKLVMGIYETIKGNVFDWKELWTT